MRDNDKPPPLQPEPTNEQRIARLRDERSEEWRRRASPARAMLEAAAVAGLGMCGGIIGIRCQPLLANFTSELFWEVAAVCVVTCIATCYRGIGTGAVMLVMAIPFMLLRMRRLALLVQDLLRQHLWTNSAITAGFGSIVIGVEGMALCGLGFVGAYAMLRGRKAR